MQKDLNSVTRDSGVCCSSRFWNRFSFEVVDRNAELPLRDAADQEVRLPRVSAPDLGNTPSGPRTDGDAPKVLVIDNYDSFTYNLVQYLGELGANLIVRRNDEITVREIGELLLDRIVVSPGPGVPENAGISISVIEEFSGKIPVLGVCLGHQAIAAAFGGTIELAQELKHGKTSWIYHEQDSILSGLEVPFEATRYHSLIVSRDDLPSCLLVNAWTEDGLVMGIRHRELDVFGVQFHPESIMTNEGKNLLRNFLCCKSLKRS